MSIFAHKPTLMTLCRKNREFIGDFGNPIVRVHGQSGRGPLNPRAGWNGFVRPI